MFLFRELLFTQSVQNIKLPGKFREFTITDGTQFNFHDDLACVDIKVQVALQFEVCWGRSEVFLSHYGLNYQSEVVAEFGPLRGPRCRDDFHTDNSRSGTNIDTDLNKTLRFSGSSCLPA